MLNKTYKLILYFKYRNSPIWGVIKIKKSIICSLVFSILILTSQSIIAYRQQSPDHSSIANINQNKNLKNTYIKDIDAIDSKNNDIWISPFIGDDIIPSITIDEKNRYVVAWTNEESATTSYIGFTYSTNPADQNEWQSNCVIYSPSGVDNPYGFDIAFVQGDEYTGLAGSFIEKTEELQGGFKMNNILEWQNTLDLWTWTSTDASDFIMCETVDQILTSDINYPSLIGWWDMFIYRFSGMQYNISQCPVFFRTDANVASGISYFDAQINEQTAPADYADYYVKDENTIHMVMTNVQTHKLIWKMLKLDEEPDIEYTPYQATIANGTQSQIAGNTNTVVIAYVENNTVKVIHSTNDGNSWQSTTIGNGKFPNICEVYGIFYLAYIDNNNLYLVKSFDEGATWSIPEQINDVEGTVVNQSKSMDVHKGGIVWTDNRNSDLDIYYQQLDKIFNVDSRKTFNTIQQAIDDNDTGYGHTIMVTNGIYEENIFINKSISLIGDNKNTTIIDGGGSGDVINIQADDINIHGFTIRNSGIDNEGINTWNYPSYENALNISDNIFYDIDHYAIYFSFTTNSIINDNQIFDCGGGIRLKSSSNSNEMNGNIITDLSSGVAIYLDRSEYNIISNNNISSSFAGVVMTAPGDFTNNNFILNNNIIYCNIGINIQYANNNQFQGNTIKENEIGININNDCNGNEIFHNSFINNVQHSSDTQNNLWYNATLQEGNYWDNYTGIDANGDGIGDTPYNVSSSNNQDLYPLMHPYGSITNIDTGVTFFKIQDAINDIDTLNGHTISVKNGTYYENIVINKSINLIGENKNTTIIDGQHNRDIIHIESDSVSISNLFVCNTSSEYVYKGINIEGQNAIVSSCIFIDNDVGINVQYTNYSTIKNCIFNNTRVGIKIRFSSNNSIDNCQFNYNNVSGISFDFASSYNEVTSCEMKNNHHGILIYATDFCLIEYTKIDNNVLAGINIHSGSNIFINNCEITRNGWHGIYIHQTSKNTITNNNISNNSNHGIYSEYFYSNHTIVQNNQLLNNGNSGIYLRKSYNWTINKNIILSNTFNGIYLTNSNNNSIYHNSIKNNTIQAVDDGINHWDNGYPSGGNYWSDYIGIDADGDWIGDTPYNITGGINQDLYPLTHPWDGTGLPDINQSIQDRGFPIRHALDGDWGAAQSFKPNVVICTYSEIYIRKFGAPEFYLEIEIREGSIDGQFIDFITFSPSEVSSSWSWFKLDFTDIPVTPGTKYFIKIPPAPSGVTTSFGYEWGYAFGNQYDNGAFWFTRDGGGLWRDLPTMYEFCFRTYGYS